VKPIHLNLAARPYRDYRPVYAVIVVTSLVLAYLMLTNFDTWYRYRYETRKTRADIERIDALTAQERSRGQIANHQLSQLDLARLDSQSKFVNAKLAERTFSWSDLLDRLESTLDKDVRLTSIAPNFGGDNLIHLTLQCEAKSTTGLVDTIDNLQHNPHFQSPFPTTEVRNEGGTYNFGIKVDYIPNLNQPSAQRSSQVIR